MPEIGSTWVAVAPSAKGFGKDLNQQVKSQNIAGQLAKTLGGAAKVAFAAIGTAAAGALTAITKTGIAFNASMQGYNAQFETLTRNWADGTHEGARLNRIMQQMKLSAPFSKSEIAQGAATLLQFGQTVDQVENGLSRLGDVAMGNGAAFNRLSQIYGQVQATGTMTQANITNMIQWGFNPLRAIAQRTGQTLEQVQREFSRSSDTAGMLTRALEYATSAGGEFYGMSATMNNTLNGSMGNLKDTFQVFSGAFVGGMNGPIMAALSGFNNSIGLGLQSMLKMNYETGMYEIASEGLASAVELVGNGIERLGKAIGDLIGNVGTRVFDFLDRVDFEQVLDGLNNMKGLLVPLGGIAAGFIGTVGGGIPVIGPMFKKLTGPVGVVIALFVKMWQESEGLRDAVSKLFTVFGEVAKELQPVFTEVAGLITKLAGSLGDVLGEAITNIVIPALRLLVPLAVQLTLAITRLLAPILRCSETMGFLITTIMGVVGAFKAVKVIMGIAKAVMKVKAAVVALLAAPKLIIIGLLAAIGAAIHQLVVHHFGSWSEAWQALQDAIFRFGERVEAFFEAFIAQIVYGWTNFTQTLSDAIQRFGDFFQKIVDAIVETWHWAVNGISEALHRLGDWFQTRFDNIAQAAQNLGDRIQSFVNRIRDFFTVTIPGFIDRLVGFFTSLPGRVMDGVNSLWERLTSFFANLMTLVSTEVTSGIDNVISFWRDLPGNILSALGNAATLLVDWGRQLIDGLLSGIANVGSRVGSAITGLLPGGNRRSLPGEAAAYGITPLGSETPSNRSLPIADTIRSAATSAAATLTSWNPFGDLDLDTDGYQMDGGSGYATMGDVAAYLDEAVSRFLTGAELIGAGVVSAEARQLFTKHGPVWADNRR